MKLSALLIMRGHKLWNLRPKHFSERQLSAVSSAAGRDCRMKTEFLVRPLFASPSTAGKQAGSRLLILKKVTRYGDTLTHQTYLTN